MFYFTSILALIIFLNYRAYKYSNINLMKDKYYLRLSIFAMLITILMLSFNNGLVDLEFKNNQILIYY